MLRAVNDMVFKFIFGEESRKELLRELINLVLEGVGLPLAATVTIRNPFSLRKFASDKEAVLDFEASDNSGRLFDLEMQIKLQETYGARALYYWSRVCGRLENLLHLLESEGGDQAMIESLTEGDRFFAEVDEAYQKFHANPELMSEYEARQKWLHDQATYIEEARADGLKTGIKEGKAEDARNLKKLGVDVGLIEKATGLSPKEIEVLCGTWV